MSKITYEQYRKQREEGVNALPLFFAFSNDQFEKAMQERGLTMADTDKVYRLGNTGGFYLKKDADVIRAYFSKGNELAELMKDEDFAVEAFYYEMNNHEYAINWEGDWDVCSVFSAQELEYGEDKTYVDYLTEAGMEYAINAYRAAKRKHLKDAEDWV